MTHDKRFSGKNPSRSQRQLVVRIRNFTRVAARYTSNTTLQAKAQRDTSHWGSGLDTCPLAPACLCAGLCTVVSLCLRVSPGDDLGVNQNKCDEQQLPI